MASSSRSSSGPLLSTIEHDVCTNFMCCNTHLPDLHALLEHQLSADHDPAAYPAQPPSASYRIPYSGQHQHPNPIGHPSASGKTSAVATATATASVATEQHQLEQPHPVVAPGLVQAGYGPHLDLDTDYPDLLDTSQQLHGLPTYEFYYQTAVRSCSNGVSGPTSSASGSVASSLAASPIEGYPYPYPYSYPYSFPYGERDPPSSPLDSTSSSSSASSPSSPCSPTTALASPLPAPHPYYPYPSIRNTILSGFDCDSHGATPELPSRDGASAMSRKRTLQDGHDREQKSKRKRAPSSATESASGTKDTKSKSRSKTIPAMTDEQATNAKKQAKSKPGQQDEQSLAAEDEEQAPRSTQPSGVAPGSINSVPKKGGKPAGPYHCPVEGCTKTYRHSNGLKYHTERGTCTINVRPPLSKRQQQQHVPVLSPDSNVYNASFAQANVQLTTYGASKYCVSLSPPIATYHRASPLVTHTGI